MAAPIHDPQWLLKGGKTGWESCVIPSPEAITHFLSHLRRPAGMKVTLLYGELWLNFFFLWLYFYLNKNDAESNLIYHKRSLVCTLSCSMISHTPHSWSALTLLLMEMASSRTFSGTELHKRGFSEWPFPGCLHQGGGDHESRWWAAPGGKHPDHTHHSYSCIQAILNPGKQPTHYPQGIHHQAGPHSDRAK